MPSLFFLCARAVRTYHIPVEQSLRLSMNNASPAASGFFLMFSASCAGVSLKSKPVLNRIEIIYFGAITGRFYYWLVPLLVVCACAVVLLLNTVPSSSRYHQSTWSRTALPLFTVPVKTKVTLFAQFETARPLIFLLRNNCERYNSIATSIGQNSAGPKLAVNERNCAARNSLMMPQSPSIYLTKSLAIKHQ